MTCQTCGEEFPTKRPQAKYCKECAVKARKRNISRALHRTRRPTYDEVKDR